MAENKRFTYRYNGDCESEWEIIDLDDDAYYGMDTTENCVKSLVKLLNELFDENEQLKQKEMDFLEKRYAEVCYLKNKIKGLEEENEQLKQALKNSYINEICENCKYGDYFLSDNFDGGFEGDFECLKKHFGNDHWECDGLTECDDFELDIKLKR